MNDFLGRRKDKQPLEYPSAGSTFKRPDGYFAGALIQECELKGKSVGGAQVSEKHAGFVINKDNATSTDILNLIDLIKNTVKAETGVTLEPEVIVLR
jgi:UDP-N-acetylmuramate dehydrogenase